jgi:DNA helicase-2/ATP-dependent DNA helicase PcrA
LSDALTAAGVRHEQVGLTEAYGEALNAQLGLLRWAIDRTAGGRRDLAVFVAANYRATTPLVTQIMDRSNPGFERALRLVLNDLGAAAEPLDVDRLGEVVVGAYGRLGAHRGQQVWVEAGRRMLSAMRLLLTGGSVEDVVAEVERAQNAALLGDARLRPRPVQVMNLHQAKGREADATILLLQQDEFHGRERPPYPKLSRLLYVVMTRARQRAYILVPGAVHLLWQPLVDACEAATAQPRAAS